MTNTQFIHAELSAVEEKEDVTILLAVESGSRAWGFDSPGSDYDVRFIYVRDYRQYLRLDERNDVIEWKLNETLDINGWDFDKTLRLLHASNPTLFEWLNSPIIYREHPAMSNLMENANAYYRPRSCLFHYLHMAKGNYRTYLKSDMVMLNKYLHVLRPILACRHILSEGTFPPIPFVQLLESQMEPSLMPDVAQLLKMKRDGTQTGLTPRRQRINDYIDESLLWLGMEIEKQPSDKPGPWQPLNDVFLRSMEIHPSNP